MTSHVIVTKTILRHSFLPNGFQKQRERVCADVLLETHSGRATVIPLSCRVHNPLSPRVSTEPIIDKAPYYHGLLPREDVRTLLKENGDFLIRISEPNPGEARSYILSVLDDKTADDFTAVGILMDSES